MHQADDLLDAARRLMRQPGELGVLDQARKRRSVSTSYYALFHFLLDEAGRRIVGVAGGLQTRRRLFARSFDHAGIKAALNKVKNARTESAVGDFLRGPGMGSAPVTVPKYIQSLARTFTDAQLIRHEADYDLNRRISEADATLIHSRVATAIADWRAANTSADRDFKHALSLLMLLGGKVGR